MEAEGNWAREIGAKGDYSAQRPFVLHPRCQPYGAYAKALCLAHDYWE